MPLGQSAFKDKSRVDHMEPKKYVVFIHNDDFTTMEFVVFILVSVFFKQEEEAMSLMLDVHHSEKAPVGTYSYDIARSKIEKATALARENGFPLQLSMAPEPDAGKQS